MSIRLCASKKKVSKRQNILFPTFLWRLPQVKQNEYKIIKCLCLPMVRTLSFGTVTIERTEFHPISHTLAEIQWKSCSFHPKPSMFLYYLRVDRISLKKCDSDKMNNYKRLWKIIDYSVHTKNCWCLLWIKYNLNKIRVILSC